MCNDLLGGCGKLVNILGMVGGKSCDTFYTEGPVNRTIYTTGRVKGCVSPTLSHYLSAQYSTFKFQRIPLFEHYLYPVSTAPTISTTN